VVYSVQRTENGPIICYVFDPVNGVFAGPKDEEMMRALGTDVWYIVDG
jgi:hypothetical protein